MDYKVPVPVNLLRSSLDIITFEIFIEFNRVSYCFTYFETGGREPSERENNMKYFSI